MAFGLQPCFIGQASSRDWQQELGSSARTQARKRCGKSWQPRGLGRQQTTGGAWAQSNPCPCCSCSKGHYFSPMEGTHASNLGGQGKLWSCCALGWQAWGFRVDTTSSRGSWPEGFTQSRQVAKTISCYTWLGHYQLNCGNSCWTKGLSSRMMSLGLPAQPCAYLNICSGWVTILKLGAMASDAFCRSLVESLVRMGNGSSTCLTLLAKFFTKHYWTLGLTNLLTISMDTPPKGQGVMQSFRLRLGWTAWDLTSCRPLLHYLTWQSLLTPSTSEPLKRPSKRRSCHMLLNQCLWIYTAASNSAFYAQWWRSSNASV